MPALAVERRARWPASESRQGTNPRAVVRAGCRALGYGDLADAEGTCEGSRCAWARAMTRRVGDSLRQDVAEEAADELLRFGRNSTSTQQAPCLTSRLRLIAAGPPRPEITYQ
jgi:hypothetical protein